MQEATRNAFGDIILELADQNPELVTVDADLAGSTKTKEFAKKYPDRAFNVGISEQDLIGTAAGLALAGKRPFACSFAIFATGRGWEQIRNTVCTSKLPVTIVGSHAGILTGEDGETHQALEDVAILRSIPGIKIFSPADGPETKAIVKHIMAKETGPCYLRLGREKVPVLFDENKEQWQIGSIKKLCQGKDLAIFASGSVVHHALVAEEKFKKDNKSVAVVNVSCLKPLDRKNIVDMLKKMPLCVTVEDHSIIGGLGSALAEVIAEEGLKCKLLRIGMVDFGESGTPQDLYQKYGIDAQGIYSKIKNWL